MLLPSFEDPLIMRSQSIESLIGNTPLVALRKLPGATSNRILAKLEGNNPGGSVKDRRGKACQLKHWKEGGHKKICPTLTP